MTDLLTQLENLANAAFVLRATVGASDLTYRERVKARTLLQSIRDQAILGILEIRDRPKLAQSMPKQLPEGVIDFQAVRNARR